MNLRHHGRYDYVPLRGRPNYRWPNGQRLAVYIALNLERFSFGEGCAEHAWRDYGNRAGAWYLHDAFDVLQLPMAAG